MRSGSSFTRLSTSAAYEYLPKAIRGRVYSDLEAFVSLTLFAERGGLPSIRELRRRWGWGHARAKAFLEANRARLEGIFKPPNGFIQKGES